MVDIYFTSPFILVDTWLATLFAWGQYVEWEPEDWIYANYDMNLTHEMTEAEYKSH